MKMSRGHCDREVKSKGAIQRKDRGTDPYNFLVLRKTIFGRRQFCGKGFGKLSTKDKNVIKISLPTDITPKLPR